MPSGRVLEDRYELGEVVGSGAMGVVHRALDRRTGKQVAIKLMRSLASEHRARFEREASILAELTHVHIVRYLGHGWTEDREPYLVMEWLEGEDLAQRLRREPIAVESAVALTRRVAEALALAHVRGIVHRDLKPSNLFLVEGRIDALKLLDFGVALLGSAIEPLTQSGVLIGTPGYMAPEQIRGRLRVDVRADVFALGCILFRCLTGEKPFPGDDVMGVLMRTLLEDAPRVRRLRPEVSQSLDALVHEMLSKAPDARPPDAGAVVARIDALPSLLGVAPADSSPPTRSSGAHAGLDHRAGNLRPPSTSFHGRARDLQRLDALLAEGQWLVTVHGPGGTGKTRFAMRYGELHIERGVWFCDLTDAQDLGGVCGAVARALDVALPTEQTSAAVVARLGRELESRGPVLVIVDNCEQVVAQVAEVLAAWHEAAPRVQFVATSRDVLRASGEWVHDLGPLSLPGEGEDVASTEAVRLFVDRARMVRQDYALGDAQAPIVAEIVRRLDGLPLAIELAAARMGALGEQTILERLQYRFDLLAGGARDAAARQRTLHDTIDWSWRLLEPWEQAALAQCAVFRGGFTLAAAEAVLDVSTFAGAPPVLDVVQALHDKSLLRSDQSAAGARRFGMYESIRVFAEEKLEVSDLASAALRRHASHYLKESDKHLMGVCDREDMDCIRQLTIELENLTAVHRRAITAASRTDALRSMLALDAILRERGPHDVHLTLLDSTLERTAGADRALVGRVTLARARTRLTRGRDAEGSADAERALAIGRAEDDAWLEASAQLWLGILETRGGFGVASPQRFAKARARFAEAGYAWRDALMVTNMAVSAFNHGRSDDARLLYEEALAGFRRLDDPSGIASALVGIAHVLHDAGRLDEARATFAEMRPLSDHLPTSMAGPALGYMATLLHERGELAEAQQLYERSLGLLRRIGHRYEWLFAAACGAVLAAQDRVVEASAVFDHATVLLGPDEAEVGGVLRLHRGHLDLARARASAAEGDAAAAVRHREQAEARLREEGGDATDDLRFATRLLRRALPAFVVARDGRWFRPDRDTTVDIARRKQLVRLLRSLVQHRVDAPGEPLSVDALLAAAWPGERFAVPRSAAMRVYVQLSRLRALGLRDALRSVGDGYLLDPAVVVAESK